MLRKDARVTAQTGQKTAERDYQTHKFFNRLTVAFDNDGDKPIYTPTRFRSYIARHTYVASEGENVVSNKKRFGNLSSGTTHQYFSFKGAWRNGKAHYTIHIHDTINPKIKAFTLEKVSQTEMKNMAKQGKLLLMGKVPDTDRLLSNKRILEDYNEQARYYLSTTVGKDHKSIKPSWFFKTKSYRLGNFIITERTDKKPIRVSFYRKEEKR